MNKGHGLGIVGFMLLMGMTYFTMQVALTSPDYLVPFSIIAFLALGAAYVILFYSFTFEGNIFIRRRFLSENLGICIFVEKGKFGRWVQVDLSKPEFSVNELMNKPIPENFIYRGATPYLVHVDGNLLTTNLYNPVPEEAKVQAQIVTTFLKIMGAISTAMAFKSVQKMLFYAIIGVGALVILVGLFIYFGGIAGLSGDIAQLKAAVAALPRPTPVPTAIGGIPVV